MENPTPETWLAWSNYLRSDLNISLSDSALDNFKILFTELVEWNEKMNLISFRSGEELLYRHFADSLACFKLVENNNMRFENLRVIDIGTGAGFPGLPCKIAAPSINITFVESITKKCGFINHIKEKLKLTDTAILNTRAEELARDSAHRSKYDILLSRAVTKLSPNIEISIPFLKRGGLALIYKTEKTASKEELLLAGNAIANLKCGLKDSFTYTLPGQENKYTILAFEKLGETPIQFPRQTGMPEKKPL